MDDYKNLAIALSSIAEILFLISAFIQLKKLQKTHIKRGIASWTWILNAAGSIAWLFYGIKIQLWPLVISNILWILACLVVLHFLVKSAAAVRVAFYIAVIATTLIFLFSGLREFAGWIAFTFSFITSIPQFLKAYKETNLSGLAEWSFRTDVIAESCVLACALILHSNPLMASALRGIAYNMFVVAEVHNKQARRKKR